MKGGKRILGKLLHPPQWFYFAIAPVVFAALICLFALRQEDSPLAYFIFALSAYALAILLAAVPGAARRVRSAIGESRPIQKFSSTALGARYLQDAAFRNGMRLCHGVVFNLLYALFRLISGLHEASIWFAAIAAYYLALGGLRGYLILGYYRRKIRGPLYAWETYITELLMGKDEINDPLIRGFRHTLMKIDFRSQWEYWYPIIQNVVEGEIQ